MPNLKRTGHLFTIVVASLLLAACGSGGNVDADASPGIGYLWYRDDMTASVIVIGPQHDRFPVDVDELSRWQLNGEVCLAKPGTRAVREGVGLAKVDVTVLEGTCQDFRGWIPSEAWQYSKP